MSIEKGRLVCLCTGIIHLIVGALLIVKPFSQERYCLYLTAAMLLVSGIGSMSAFVVKARSRFRPGWLLPQGITGVLMGVVMGIIMFSGVYDISLLFNEILAYFAIITAILHLSASIQIKCLGFSGWWIIFAFGVVDLVYGIFAYFQMLQAKSCSFTAFGIFFILLAFQFFAENVSYKVTIHRDNSEFN